ncbi:MAG: bifunctional diaminohydroxyphosphoribosylaminopyrimidine deaminase/5-amino-6-(5-phosphoribosylamino)uracil reductase RibD [Bacteroidetes bacterium]|nr:bifunctional diaminohydroxyphosphoribosylaminopyrimidine deaminase/5-amino-6-(5-phosphoribosylamino)uracil reductase RibD [Bacteroidota bacterium]
MHRALFLAKLGLGKVAPNPVVGCVIVHDNIIIGEGYHQFYGGPHAEVNALKQVENPDLLKKATVYVTLEPCSHFGKTPPCSELLIKSGVKNVVIGTRDSNPLVSGKGIDKLKKAGIDVIENVLENECRKINRRFFTFHEKSRPYVILKWAQTSDGYLDKQRSLDQIGINWITEPETKSLVHKWRSEEQAILVGRNTIMNDNPSLTVRDFSGKNPIRIVIDSQLAISNMKNVFSDDAETLVFNRIKNEKIGNIEWIKIQETNTDLILKELYKRGIQSVLVEGGSRTLQYFIIDNVWDEARVIVGNVQFGGGVKAPVLNKLPNDTYLFGKDRIYNFVRK